jgi:hypothetical protein
MASFQRPLFLAYSPGRRVKFPPTIGSSSIEAIFFADFAAKYDEAKPGSLRLIPPLSRHAAPREDYTKMREMIFDEPPSFEHLFTVLTEIERQIAEPM